jgi:hypothetical protein
MFEEYLQDAHELFCAGDDAANKFKEREAKRYFRAAVFYTASAMEAFLNYIGDSFNKAERLSSHERAFLNDNQLVFDPIKGSVITQTRYYGIDDKLKFLIHKFIPKYNIGKSKAWANFIDFKDLRDSLVHPRQVDDEIEIKEYREKLLMGMFGTITLMNDISKGVFKRPLRKKVLDLIPE